MRFQLAINLERIADDIDMRDVARHTLETNLIRLGTAVAVAPYWHPIRCR